MRTESIQGHALTGLCGSDGSGNMPSEVYIEYRLLHPLFRPPNLPQDAPESAFRSCFEKWPSAGVHGHRLRLRKLYYGSIILFMISLALSRVYVAFADASLRREDSEEVFHRSSCIRGLMSSGFDLRCCITTQSFTSSDLARRTSQ